MATSATFIFSIFGMARCTKKKNASAKFDNPLLGAMIHNENDRFFQNPLDLVELKNWFHAQKVYHGDRSGKSTSVFHELGIANDDEGKTALWRRYLAEKENITTTVIQTVNSQEKQQAFIRQLEAYLSEHASNESGTTESHPSTMKDTAGDAKPDTSKTTESNESPIVRQDLMNTGEDQTSVQSGTGQLLLTRFPADSTDDMEVCSFAEMETITAPGKESTDGQGDDTSSGQQQSPIDEVETQAPSTEAPITEMNTSSQDSDMDATSSVQPPADMDGESKGNTEEKTVSANKKRKRKANVSALKGKKKKKRKGKKKGKKSPNKSGQSSLNKANDSGAVTCPIPEIDEAEKQKALTFFKTLVQRIQSGQNTDTKGAPLVANQYSTTNADNITIDSRIELADGVNEADFIGAKGARSTFLRGKPIGCIFTLLKESKQQKQQFGMAGQSGADTSAFNWNIIGDSFGLHPKSTQINAYTKEVTKVNKFCKPHLIIGP